MNSEQRRLEELKNYFVDKIPIDQKSGLRNFSKFDCDVIDAIRELQNRFADKQKVDFTINDECKRLGFVIKEDSGIYGCSTIPCFGGKMPYQSEPIVACAIGQTMCDESPIQSMRVSKAFEDAEAKLKEKARLKKNAAARTRCAAKKNKKSSTIGQNMFHNCTTDCDGKCGSENKK